MFTLSPTFPVTLRFTFSSKSNAVVLRLRWGNDGLSTFFLFTPSLSSAVPCVFTLTPPGPNIFSAGPKSKCMSEKSNFSLPLLSNSSAFFFLKNSPSAFFSLHWRYSSGVIIIGVLRYESPIFDPIKYTLRESLYTTSCFSTATGNSLATLFGAVLSSCGGTASAHTLRNITRAIDSLNLT